MINLPPIDAPRSRRNQPTSMPFGERSRMDSADRPIKLVIVDENELFREGLKEIFSNYSDLAVLGEAGSQSELLAVLPSMQDLDVVLLDVVLPRVEAAELVREIRTLRPTVSVIILTMYDDGSLLRSLLPLGIRGYILKSASRHELVSAVRAARSKSDKITLAVRPETLVYLQGSASSVALSRLESHVLRLASRGLTNAQIGRQLDLTEPSVKRHMRNIFAKLGAVSRIDAVNKAREVGLIADRALAIGGSSWSSACQRATNSFPWARLFGRGCRISPGLPSPGRRGSSGPATAVVSSAINTMMVNMPVSSTPSEAPTLSTINSVSPRVFMSKPSVQASRQLSLDSLAGPTVPMTLPPQAVQSIAISARMPPKPRPLMFTARPLTTKKAGTSSVATCSTGCLSHTSSTADAWRGIIRPNVKAPKIGSKPAQPAA
jgi:DNA-binding NarL/FixJ family response regulator